jgi:hypothetical protein
MNPTNPAQYPAYCEPYLGHWGHPRHNHEAVQVVVGTARVELDHRHSSGTRPPGPRSPMRFEVSAKGEDSTDRDVDHPKSGSMP